MRFGKRAGLALGCLVAIVLILNVAARRVVKS